MADPKLVLVTGATGAVGPAVVALLCASGYRVRTLSRTRPADPFPPDVDVALGDIADERAVRAALAGVGGVLHLAARLHLAGPPSRDVQAYQRVNVEGTTVVTSAACGAGVGRLVCASTIAVYGPTMGPPATETSPLNPETPYARTKLAAEDVVRQAVAADGRPLGTVLRLAAIYGPRVKGNYRTLVDALSRGRFIPIGSGRNRRTLVHERDAAHALLLALESPAAAGKTFNVTDGSVHTTDDIVAAICRALGRPVPRWHIPRAAAFAAAEIGDLALAAVGREAALGDRLRRYVEDVAVDGSAIQRDLGFAPRYSLEQGWREAVAERR